MATGDASGEFRYPGSINRIAVRNLYGGKKERIAARASGSLASCMAEIEKGGGMLVHYKTISELRQLNREQGYNFFHRDTMKFWGSTVYPNVSTGGDGWYFVTSEKQLRNHLPIRFTIRKMLTNGRVTTAGRFQEYATLDDALAVMKEAAHRERGLADGKSCGRAMGL